MNWSFLYEEVIEGLEDVVDGSLDAVVVVRGTADTGGCMIEIFPDEGLFPTTLPSSFSGDRVPINSTKLYY